MQSVALTVLETLVHVNSSIMPKHLAARGKSPPAFERRCIPPDCVFVRGVPPRAPRAEGSARRSNMLDILAPRALSDGRILSPSPRTPLGASPDFCHGLLVTRVDVPDGINVTSFTANDLPANWRKTPVPATQQQIRRDWLEASVALGELLVDRPGIGSRRTLAVARGRTASS